MLKKLLLIAGLALGLAACDKVPAGNVGVKVYLLGSDKGVDTETLPVGRYWIGWNEELFLFPTSTQNYVWTADSREGSPEDESFSFQTVDGMVANADIGISYHIDPEKVTDIFQRYRRGVPEITDTFLRNMVRDALVKIASNKPIEYIYGAGKAALIEEVQTMVTDQVAPIGIIVEKIYWISDIRVPDNVKASINSKIEASQLTAQRENEVKTARADADKKIEEARGQAESILKVAEAQAKANKILAASLSPELTNYMAIERWDGVLPTTMLPGSALPLVNIK